MTTIEDIHESLINGQRKQMTAQIDEYGSDFWADFADHLDETGPDNEWNFAAFKDAVISYHRIKD